MPLVRRAHRPKLARQEYRVPETSYTRIMREHDEIEMLSGRLSNLVRDRAADPQVLADALRHLKELVSDHLDHEDALLETLAARSGTAAQRDRIARAEQEFCVLKENWQRFTRAWDATTIAADRSGFDQSTLAMLPRLRDRVRLESELLMALAMLERSNSVSPNAGE